MMRAASHLKSICVNRSASFSDNALKKSRPRKLNMTLHPSNPIVRCLLLASQPHWDQSFCAIIHAITQNHVCMHLMASGLAFTGEYTGQVEDFASQCMASHQYKDLMETASFTLLNSELGIDCSLSVCASRTSIAAPDSRCAQCQCYHSSQAPACLASDLGCCPVWQGQL